MSRQVVLAAAFAVVSLARADLGQKLNKVKTSINRAGDVQPSCPTCPFTLAGTGNDISSLMKDCVESICPTDDLSLSASYNRMIERASTPDPVFDKEIAPLVSAIARAEANALITRNNMYLGWLKDPKELSAPGAIRVFNLFAAVNGFSQFKFKTQDDKQVVDEEASRAAFSSLGNDEFKKQVLIGNQILAAFQDAAFPESDPGRIQLYYPGTKFNDRVNETLSSIKEQGEKIVREPELKFLNDVNEFRELVSAERLRLQFSASNQINPSLIQDLNRANSFMNLLHSLAFDADFKKILDSPPINIKNRSKLFGHEQILQSQIKQANAVLTGPIDAIQAKCKVAFVMAQNSLPTSKNIADFEKRVAAIKSKFITKTSGLLCPQGKPQYAGAANEWLAALPLSKEQHLANMKASLSQALESAKTLQLQHVEIDQSPNRDAIYAAATANLNDEPRSDLSSADDICHELIPDLLPDATAFFSKHFVVGPIAVAKKNAEGVCHHEMGHKLFHFMKLNNPCEEKSQFKKIRSCLLANHSELTDEARTEQEKKAAQGLDTKYESEDWADLISALVDEKSDNFACLFARKSQASDYAELSLRKPGDSGPHSSDLFRLLHLNFLKTGKIPERCEVALAARGEKANFKNCLSP